MLKASILGTLSSMKKEVLIYLLLYVLSMLSKCTASDFFAMVPKCLLYTVLSVVLKGSLSESVSLQLKVGSIHDLLL